jgi:hypothetical protein
LVPIAFYLGELLLTSSKIPCGILSQDKGFDPLAKHLNGRGFTVRRAATLVEAFPKQANTGPAKSSTIATHG